MRLIVVGGVAGGATAAARARRLSEDAEIIVFERGQHVSFANCGLPYYVGQEIVERESLLLETPESLHARYRLDVRAHTEVLAIERAEHRVRVRDLESGREYTERYDRLILSPGATPIRPPLPGIEHPRIFSLRTVPDGDKIKAMVDGGARRAVVVGGGFIGLEMAENLRRREASHGQTDDRKLNPGGRKPLTFPTELQKVYGANGQRQPRDDPDADFLGDED